MPVVPETGPPAEAAATLFPSAPAATAVAVPSPVAPSSLASEPAASVPPTSLPATPVSPAASRMAGLSQQPQPLADGLPPAPSAPLALQPAQRTLPATPSAAITAENPFAVAKPAQEVSVIRPSGLSADDLFDQGMRQLREGHTDAAYEAFLQCYHSGQQLDRVRQRQLGDFLRDLAPAHAGRPASLGRGAGPEPWRSATVAKRDPDRCRRPTAGLEVREAADGGAERAFQGRASSGEEPDKALKILGDAIANVEKSDLGSDAVAPLLHLLNRSKSEIEGRQRQLAPVAAQQQRNTKVRDELEIDQQYKIRVEQEFADLVEEYNKLVKQDRWAEAELIAKQAKELDKENPFATIMFEKRASVARSPGMPT